MTEDLGTTKRKPLTPTQRLALFERHRGICSLCGNRIRAGEPWIDEHMRALGLAGSNAPENRGIAHKACADAKTYGVNGDLARIAKAKRQKMSSLGIKGENRRPLQGRGFDPAPPQKSASRKLSKVTLCFRD